MKRFLKGWNVALCGAITSALTAMIVLLIYKLTKFNLFTLSFWLVVPVGAVITGIAASLGYLYGSLYVAEDSKVFNGKNWKYAHELSRRSD